MQGRERENGRCKVGGECVCVLCVWVCFVCGFGGQCASVWSVYKCVECKCVRVCLGKWKSVVGNSIIIGIRVFSH